MKIENAFGILKNKFQILNNLNVDLRYAPTIVTTYCILHNFMIDEGGSSEIEIMDNELNSSWPFNLDYSREERRSKTIAKEQLEILFQNWMRSKYKSEIAIEDLYSEDTPVREGLLP